MHVTIAVISDLHYGQRDEAADERRGDLADLLLNRAVDRLNRSIRPDVTLLPGDMVDDGEASGAKGRLEQLRSIADRIDSPIIAVPGNHDSAPDEFYTVFDRAPQHFDVKGFRFVAFVDPEEPGWNARREPSDMAGMADARAGFDGPIITVQHVPLFPPGASDCPYNYTNAEKIIAAMHKHGYILSVSGHFHAGMDLMQADGIGFVAAPALCEYPFRFLEIVLENGAASVREHALASGEADGDLRDILLNPIE